MVICCGKPIQEGFAILFLKQLWWVIVKVPEAGRRTTRTYVKESIRLPGRILVKCTLPAANLDVLKCLHAMKLSLGRICRKEVLLIKAAGSKFNFVEFKLKQSWICS